MKKRLLISSIILSSSLATQAAVADVPTSKKVGLFGSGAVIGAVVGGPVGYLLGAATGAYIAEKQVQVDNMEDQITNRSHQIELLEDELAFKESTLSTVKNSVASLEMQLKDEAEAPVFFETGSDQLTLQAKQNLAATIEYLQSKNDVQVWLEGYTDPRGTDGYNLTLSQARAKNVKAYLIDNGIAEETIQAIGYGMKNSTHDTAMFDLERRVEINLDSHDTTNIVMK